MTLPEPTPQPLDVWHAELCRLSIFLKDQRPIDTTAMWTLATGVNPDATASQPKLGIYQSDGMLGDSRLVLVNQPSRLDWLYLTAFDPELGDVVHDRLQLFEAGLGSFTALLTPWLSACPPAQRVALGVVIRQSVSTFELGYERLKTYLPKVQIDAANSNDLFYQINRPRASTRQANLQINRLNKWNVVKHIYARIDLPSATVQAAEGSEVYYIRGEFDVNTAAEYMDGFETAQMPQLLSELLDLTTELARLGDKP